ncbi:MAG: prolyl oligopeptidase family serine peptidase, partial [Clostridia bacterium]|nr:prolyl oligopeptidase family serine peptidase [Clostridia bacterium]
RYDTPLWIFHGTADTAVPYESAEVMKAALAEKAPALEVRFTAFEGAGHGIWAATADTEGLFDWLFSKRR